MTDSSYRCAKFFTALFLPVVFIACSRDKDIDKGAAAYIAASEAATLPAAIAIPENGTRGYTRVATYYAAGVQQYKAKEKEGSNPVAYEWVFVAPQASLYDASNKVAGSHGAGPYWQVAADSIFAQPFSPAKTAPAPDGDSIDWLLLAVKPGTIPTGIFADADYIQRIATRGGKAPATPPVYAAATANVPYEAVYRFTKKNN